MHLVTHWKQHNGQYFFVPKYSPHLKPIEPCFALVKQYIRQNEEIAKRDPIAFINLAFQRFAIGGLKAGSVRGHWKGYFHAY